MKEFIPSKFYLSQNAPNPFAEETKIKYCLPVKSKVHLAIINSKGKIIELLVNKTQQAGTYEIKYKNLQCKKGKYYFRMIAKEFRYEKSQLFSDTKCMIVT